MNSRLYEKLNQFFLPPKVHNYTHQAAIVWAFLEKSFSNMAKSSFVPKQLQVMIHFDDDYRAIAFLSDGTKENLNTFSLQGLLDAIPRAEVEGLKVEVDLSKNNFTFKFTPSNY